MEKYLSEKIRNLSFFSMLLVVLLHSYNLGIIHGIDGLIVQEKSINCFIQNLFSQQICRIAVPLFFVFSGYLFFVNMSLFNFIEFLEKYKTRFYSLFLPYIIWCVLGFLFFFSLQLVPQVKEHFNSIIISDLSFFELIIKIFLDPFSFQLWFLKDLLLIIFLLSPLIFVLIKYLGYVFLFVVGIPWVFNISYFNIAFFVNFDTASIFFFSLGALLAIKKIDVNSVSSVKSGKILLLSWLVVVFSLTITGVFGYVDTFGYKIIFKLAIILGLYALWCFYDSISLRFLKIKKIYSFSASFSFFLYLFHEPMLTCLKRVLLLIFGRSDFVSLIDYFVSPILIILLSITIAFLLKKHIPRFYSVLIGGR